MKYWMESIVARESPKTLDAKAMSGSVCISSAVASMESPEQYHRAAPKSTWDILEDRPFVFQSGTISSLICFQSLWPFKRRRFFRIPDGCLSSVDLFLKFSTPTFSVRISRYDEKDEVIKEESSKHARSECWRSQKRFADRSLGGRNCLAQKK
jgi:hypothetical protein